MPGNTERLRGQIIRSQSGFFTVATPNGNYICQLRGKLKHGRREGDVAAVGDWVQITPLGGQAGGGAFANKQGRIELVEPRQRAFVRMAPSPRGLYQQVILANLDQVVLVFACAEPEPRWGMLDRFLVITEKQGIPAIIVANKVDLVGLPQAQEMFAPYPAIGYPVIFTSVELSLGIATLGQQLQGRLSLLTGPSGVGKSSLLNKIQPGLGLEVRQVSQATSKGRHTTVVRQLVQLEGGGYVADTPGLKALALWDIQPEEIDGYFPELRPLVAECQFSDCTHLHEPGCAVRAAVERGEVHPRRYRSYLRMRFDEVE